MRKISIEFFKHFLIICSFCPNIYGQNTRVNKKPNVIIVITDDQGKGDLGFYGNKVIRTPNIDAFASESVRLENFHVSPTCAPSRGALMAGKHTNRLNTYHTIGGRSLLFSEETLLPEIFQKNGYATGMFGKWHLGDNYPLRPEDRGFEEVVRHGGGGIGQAPDFWGNDYFDDTYWYHGKNHPNTTTKKYEGYCTDVFFEEALSFVKNNQNNPFFLYLSTNAPHGPLNLPEEYLDLYEGDNRITKTQQRFYGMITNIDDNFKKLDDTLKTLGIKDNTILIFMTDNGTAAGKVIIKDGVTYGHSAGLRGSKLSPYEGGHRVPFMIRWPKGNFTTSKEIDQLTAHFDILPTLIDLAKLNHNTKIEIDGTSLAPLLRGQSNQWQERTLFVDNQRMQNLVKYKDYAVMDGHWRLVNGKELYDLSKDLGQLVNVIDKYPKVAERLSDAYTQEWENLNTDVLNAKHQYIRVGTPFEQVTKLSSHDMLTGTMELAWHQKGPLLGSKGFGRWKVEFTEDATYKIGIRRFPRESGLGLNAKVMESSKNREIDENLPPSSDLNLKKAYLYLAGFKKEIAIAPHDQEITFTTFVPQGKFDLEAQLISENGQVYPAYYVYVEKVH